MQKILTEMLYTQLQQSQYLKEKYDQKMGIYSMAINGKIVYIGKSTNILHRIASHMFLTQNLQFTKSHKYKIFNQCLQQGIDIQFDIMCQCADEDELGYVEGRLIREHMPILNYQIPKPENYHSYTVNRIARSVSLEQILAEG